ncbi:MAG: hypothetical protein RIR62_2079 [Pseudomonadota bacterium]|jgi:hypothetical protein
MPKLIRLYIQSVAIGFALSAIFVAMLVWFDVGGLNGLVLGSNMGWVAAAMLVVSNGIIFAGAQFGIRVMMLAEDDDAPRGGRRARGPLPGAAIPVRVEAQAPRPHLPRRRH